MKLIKLPISFFLGSLTLFLVSNAKASGCSSHIEKKANIECFSDDEKYINPNEKKLFYEVEA